MDLIRILLSPCTVLFRRQRLNQTFLKFCISGIATLIC